MFHYVKIVLNRFLGRGIPIYIRYAVIYIKYAVYFIVA